MGGHVALLGDSILDNGAYVGSGPDVAAQLRARLPAHWGATLLAVDGSTTRDLGGQLTKISSDVTHLVISIGGNDAILNSDLLGSAVSSTAEAISAFAVRADAFERDYRAAIGAACALDRRTTVCTIYNGNLSVIEAPLARIALRVFNDVILRVAFERHLDVIDLRLICSEAADYANEIEPSVRGGSKIAAAVARSLGVMDEDVLSSRVYAR
jgi:hypothetical protein